jgi:hypothetical protein
MSIQYCTQCSAAMEIRIPSGDERARHVCTVCGNIYYQNPKLVYENDIPWDDIAFPVIQKTLLHYFRDRKTGIFEFQSLELAKPLDYSFRSIKVKSES